MTPVQSLPVETAVEAVPDRGSEPRVRRLSLDARIKWISITCMFFVGLLAIRWQGLGIPLSDLARVLGFATATSLGATYFRLRRVDHFALTLVAVMQFLLFTCAYTLLMYIAASINGPLCDSLLMRMDAACHVHVPAVAAWGSAHDTVGRLLECAYHTLIPQTILLVVVFGLTGRQRPLDLFLLRLMAASLVTLLIFAVMPAAGPFVGYGYEPDPSQARYLEHLYGMRSGGQSVFSFYGAEGLITFPSFHTAWAILLAAAFTHRRWLLAGFGLLNLAVIVATMTTGWHYASDVLGGVMVAVLVIVVTRRFERQLYDDPQELPESSTLSLSERD